MVLALLGAPYIYDISSLRVKVDDGKVVSVMQQGLVGGIAALILNLSTG